MEKQSDTKKIITRFAPSPTGYLHIGGARTALFNFLFSKNKNGKFLLRIEDTDKKRSTKEAIDAILQGLDWLGLNPDEAPVFQSQNNKRHQEAAFELLKSGRAYKCFISAEELQKNREESEKKGEVFRFASPYRDADSATLQAKEEQPFVVRLKAPKHGEIVIHDLVQGEIRVKCEEIDDLVLLRADLTPTYMLAVVVDDHDMEISHVIRGDDHLTNSFRQKAIYDAFGWNAPQFAHIPLIHGVDGAKLSKRHGATSVIDYKQMGYLPEAMRNYLLRLGFSDGDKEIISDQEACTIFDFKKVGKSPSRFDFAKLDFINKHYIKQKSDTELFALIEEFLIAKKAELLGLEASSASAQIEAEEKSRILKALKFLKEKPNRLNEIAVAALPYLNSAREIFAAIEALGNEKLLAEIKVILGEIQEWNHDEIKNALMKFAQENGLKIKDFGLPLRVALTFSSSSAGGIFDVVEALGKEEVLARLEL